MSLAEHMEHVGHADHVDNGHGHADAGKKSVGKYIGITMAVMGVVLALCSAMLGGARNKLIATMVAQTNTAQRYQAISMKHRTLMAQLQQLHALLPADASDFEKSEAQINRVVAKADPKVLAAVEVSRLETAKILNTVTPTGSDVLRFVELVKDYRLEAEKANEWVESYEDAISAHEEASEHFEWAQLLAEFGIVIASVALLLQNRGAWLFSVVLGGSSIAIIVWTLATSGSALHRAEAKIEEAKKSYLALNMAAKQEKGDEELVADIERIEAPSQPVVPHAAARANP